MFRWQIFVKTDKSRVRTREYLFERLFRGFQIFCDIHNFYQFCNDNFYPYLCRKKKVIKFMAPTITEEQKLLLQQTTLQNGMNAWDYVLSEREEDQPWAIVGILSCMKKGYNLNAAMICWEARDLRYAQNQ